MKSRFADFFPVPAFLEMRPVGLAISEQAIHLVEFLKTPKGLRLGKFGVRNLPSGAIKEGYVNDKAAVTDVLRSLQAEFLIDFVNASLPEEKAYFFKTEFPRTAISDLRQSVELQLEENVPISAQDAIFDYVVVGDVPNSDKVQVGVSVLPSKVVDTYLEIIKSAGLRPLSFGVEASAISRAVIKNGSSGTCMIVNVADNRTSLSVVTAGVVQFNLSIGIGGEAITTAVSKHLSVSLEEAKRIKEDHGFSKTKDSIGLFLSTMGVLSSIKDEINKLFIYWQTHSGSSGSKISKIVLCGRDTSLTGLDEYLASEIKVPVEVANVWQNAFSYEDFVPDVPFLDSLDYASAIGLALPEEI